jgi:hypothetical protein
MVFGPWQMIFAAMGIMAALIIVWGISACLKPSPRMIAAANCRGHGGSLPHRRHKLLAFMYGLAEMLKFHA